MDLFFLCWLCVYLGGVIAGAVRAGQSAALFSSGLRDFCRSLTGSGPDYFGILLPDLTTLFVLLLIGLMPGGQLLIWPFVFGKAFCSGFCIDLFYLASDTVVRFPAIFGMLFYSALLMPVFYFFCSRARGSSSGGYFRASGLPPVVPAAACAYLALAALLEYALLRRLF